MIPKNDDESVRVAFSTFGGVTFLDLRTFYRDRLGDLRATPRAVTLPPERLPALIEALHLARNEAVRRGLLPIPRDTKQHVNERQDVTEIHTR